MSLIRKFFIVTCSLLFISNSYASHPNSQELEGFEPQINSSYGQYIYDSGAAIGRHGLMFANSLLFETTYIDPVTEKEASFAPMLPFQSIFRDLSKVTLPYLSEVNLPSFPDINILQKHATPLSLFALLVNLPMGESSNTAEHTISSAGSTVAIVAVGAALSIYAGYLCGRCFSRPGEYRGDRFSSYSSAEYQSLQSEVHSRPQGSERDAGASSSEFRRRHGNINKKIQQHDEKMRRDEASGRSKKPTVAAGNFSGSMHNLADSMNFLADVLSGRLSRRKT